MFPELLRLGKHQEGGGRGFVPRLDSIKAGMCLKYLLVFFSQLRVKFVFAEWDVKKSLLGEWETETLLLGVS